MRRKRQGWVETVARWEASGESATHFAKRVGTTAGTLSRWQRELRDVPRVRGAAPALAKIVELRPAQRCVADGWLEVRLVDGRSVGVPPTFDADALGRLLRVLEAAR